MAKLSAPARNTGIRHLLAATSVAMLVLIAIAAPIAAKGRAQTVAAQAHTPEWQTAAGGKMKFDAATVILAKAGLPPAGSKPSSSVSLDAADANAATSGELSATNFTLLNYIGFAYKLSGKQLGDLLSQLPKWALTERFDIEARAQGNPTKDQMRLMVQALLADRFKLTTHYGTRQAPVFALTVVTPGRAGPRLQPHAEGSPCDMPAIPRTSASSPPPLAIRRGAFPGFPAVCGGFVPSPRGLLAGARNVGMETVATLLNGIDGLDRPIVDRTGLSGTFDFILEFTPERSGPPPPGGLATVQGQTFSQALQDQLGLKLEPQVGQVDVLVVDHVEEPSTN